eukprot:gene19809-21749_t
MICLPPHTSHALQPCDVALFRPLKVCWKDVLKLWFRETRPQNVDKAVFPTLLSKLWSKIKPSNAVAGFSGSGLLPLDRKRVQPKIVDVSMEHQLSQTAPDTPRKLMKEAVIAAVTPSPSEQTKLAMLNSKKKRKRVQAKIGEVLTADDVVERLRIEQVEREQTKSKKQAKIVKGQHSFEVIKPEVTVSL